MAKINNSDAIIHVVSSLEVGGAERFVIDLCQLQRRNGSRVAILSFGIPSDPLVKECELHNIEVIHVGVGRVSKWLNSFSAVMNFNTIHFHSPYPLKFLLPILPFIWLKQVIYTRHGADPLAGYTWRTMHKLVKFFVNKVSFVSQEGAEVFERSHGWKNKTKHVIDNGVNLDQVAINREKHSQFRIGSVGRMVDLKNQISLLQAINCLDEKNKKRVQVHFFGDGPCLEKLCNYTKSHNLTDCVVFHGMVSDRDSIYNSIDALAVTSETEGLSLAIMEAMAYECPIFASDVGGNSKLVSHNVNGFLFAYNDYKALASHILSLVNSLETVKTFAQNGRAKIEEQFSLVASANKYEQLYNS